ncbi:anthrone oxygenase family protein [Cellulosimicrobium sp. Marseille-Q4280]|uniref:anthrone oxygenase family protein n=1 Tax=Cellulosimicrobium sp. Marseille-Q4280 TaxID=2937992 RepID=UPI0020419641|nr:anthrone oxygenase family protein [Cellulosimicrobium sp. Marseille-Q4280]
MSAFEVLVVAAAVATGLAGGVLYAFSAFVMAGLRRLDPGAGAAAMRSINVTAVRPPLMLLLAASVLLPAGAAVVGLVGGADGAGWALAGAVVALVGILGITAVGNVPLNDRLDAATDPAAEWLTFVPRWLAWNHARTAAGAVATALLAVALVV